jgi:hypothetical protein
MHGKKNRKTNSINRRSFVGTTAKLVTFGTLLMPLVEACGNKKSSNTGTTAPDTAKAKISKNISKKHPRKKWSHEALVINTQTSIVHFPTSKVYRYYDEIKTNHLKEINLPTWASEVNTNPVGDTREVRFNRSQSGNILEILSLRNLTQGVNDEYLNAAANDLALAFSPYCDDKKGINANTTNFRLHELMLQLISLNTGIPIADKWQVFNSKIKKPTSLRKRQQWMATEVNFNERVNYILNHQNDYMTRLTERARKYSFT